MKCSENKMGGIEITTFKLKDGSFEDFITANAAIDSWLKTQRGFRSRHITEKQDKTIMDLLF